MSDTRVGYGVDLGGQPTIERVAVTHPPARSVQADPIEPGAAPPSIRQRFASRLPSDRASSWIWTGLVALIAFTLRLVGLGYPDDKVFDEVYYAKEANDLLQYAAEQNKEGNGPGYVVHPPLGKWMIAAGEHFYGYDSFGWRISAAVIGALSVLLIARIARRMFGSTLLGCLAGLLLALDGLHFVMSRVALLDIFLMFWILVAFACLLLDRDSRRRRLLDRLMVGEDLSQGAGRLRGELPWWRLAAAASLGLAMGVKWSASWFVFGFLVLMLCWDVGARRTAGVRKPFRDTLAREGGWLAVFAVVLVGVYLTTWTGWFLSDDGWNRDGNPWPGADVPFVPDALRYLIAYHAHAYEFHTGLSTKHDYQSTPWSWLTLGRPVAYYYTAASGCGANSCAAEILALGNPILWWLFIPSIVYGFWRWLAKRDWRAGAILLVIGIGIVPWTFYPERTMFFFYTLPVLPFLVLGVVQAMGAVLGPAYASQDRRLIGVVAAGAAVVAIAVTFAYFYPIWTGEQMTYAAWHHRMWFDSWV